MADLNTLCKARGYVRTRATNLCNKFIAEQATMTRILKLQTLEKLNSIKSELDVMNKQIFPLYVSEPLAEPEINKRSTC